MDSADIMANLLILKAEVEDKIGSRMRMVFSGATEAHLLAEEIGKGKKIAHEHQYLNGYRRCRCWGYS